MRGHFLREGLRVRDIVCSNDTRIPLLGCIGGSRRDVPMSSSETLAAHGRIIAATPMGESPATLQLEKNHEHDPGIWSNFVPGSSLRQDSDLEAHI
jgi:hypothetical protein